MLAVCMGEAPVVIAVAVSLEHAGSRLAPSAVGRSVGLVVAMQPAVEQSWWGPAIFGLGAGAAVCCEKGVDLSLGVHGGTRCAGSGGRGDHYLFLDAEVSNGGSREIKFDVWLLGFDICQ